MRPRIGFRAGILGLFCAVVAPACDWSPDTTSGLSSLIRVQGGQAFRGSISDPPATSPATASISPGNSTIFAGATDRNIPGRVGPDSNTAAIGVAGDQAYWRVPALTPDPTNADLFTFAARLSLTPVAANSPLLDTSSDGTVTLSLSVRAIDAAGNFGTAEIQQFIFLPETITGSLAISLQWDSPTDLDLHVLVPADNEQGYTEVWSKKRSSYNGADGGSPDGVLDFDSNANCQIDGHDTENVIWKGTPPVGHYVVRVAAASLCGQASAAWWAFASVPDQSKGEATGVLTEAAARNGAAPGSGVTVLEFDYP